MMEGVRPELSVVVPAYNEATRLPRTIERVERFLDGRSYEIVVVDDGSTDGTVEAARAAARRELVVLRNEGNRGKGYAVRRGMLAARAPRRLMSDADLSTPIEELGRLEPCLDAGHDVAIGSRALAGSRIEVRQPWYRENMGRVFNVCVRALAVPGVRDTQCGFKLFSARAADAVFASARLDGFSFDVEALFIARQLGYRIAEVPVVWRNDAATRVGLLGGFRAFPDLLRIRVNDWRGCYEPGRTPAPGGSAL
jgi:dolichyl-phosphate beta-glucosyltransferase